MVRRSLAVFAGMAVCQVTMIVSLALGFGLLALPAGLEIILAAIFVLLTLPGLAGGVLAGFLTDRFGWFYGLATGLLFAETIVLVRLLVAPQLGLSPQPFDVVIYPSLLLALSLAGLAGGILGHRWRLAGPRAGQRASALERRLT